MAAGRELCKELSRERRVYILDVGMDPTAAVLSSCAIRPRESSAQQVHGVTLLSPDNRISAFGAVGLSSAGGGSARGELDDVRHVLIWRRRSLAPGCRTPRDVHRSAHA